MLDFRNCDLRRRRHHGIKISRGFSVYEIAPLIALPCFHESKIGLECTFHYICAAIELPGFLVFGDDGPHSGRREESWNARAPGTHSLGKCTLRREFQVNSLLKYHLLEQ